MAAGAEADELVRVTGIRFGFVELGFELRGIDQEVFGGRLARQRVWAHVARGIKD